METNTENIIKTIWNLLEQVNDPEVPVLSILDLGIVRDVKINRSFTPVADCSLSPVANCSLSPLANSSLPPLANSSLSPLAKEEEQIEIIITPTYSGCPAMDAISVDIKMKLLENGYKKFKVTLTLSPAWTTDWMTEKGKQKLKEYGIAPPKKMNDLSNTNPDCPQCKSDNTKLLSQFGSTACKALYQCNECKEPFDYFKCH